MLVNDRNTDCCWNTTNASNRSSSAYCRTCFITESLGLRAGFYYIDCCYITLWAVMRLQHYDYERKVVQQLCEKQHVAWK